MIRRKNITASKIVRLFSNHMILIYGNLCSANFYTVTTLRYRNLCASIANFKVCLQYTILNFYNILQMTYFQNFAEQS